jgi:uncharacterized LabA/DUF88 family protein
MRISVFVDYWNLQLTLNQRLSEKHGIDDYRARIDWRNLGPRFVTAAADVLGIKTDAPSYEGTHIFTSYNPATDEGKKFKNWATTWLDRQPGLIVQVRERKPRSPPKCPTCRREITHCPHHECGVQIRGTVEKGIDTLLVTDLIRLAFADTYDVAVIASLDADMVPAVQFVQTKGKKIIQAGFPPKGIDLATECWGSFDIMKLVPAIASQLV